MSINICVEGFSSTTTEEELRRLFSPLGAVAAVRIETGVDGQFLGIAAVQMFHAHEAEIAVQALNRRRLNGKGLLVFLSGS